jgi:hypothetical protein
MWRVVGLLVTGFVLGAVVMFGYQMTRVRPLLRMMLEFDRQALEAQFETAYRLADYSTVECTHERLRFLASAILSDANDDEKRLVLRSLGLSYGRLAKAAEKAGRLEDRDKFLGAGRVTLHEIDPGFTTNEQVQALVTLQDSTLGFRSCGGVQNEGGVAGPGPAVPSAGKSP